MASETSPKRVRAPNPLEKTCLAHLDEVENWKILRCERPSESTILGWKPFVPIFRINVTLFTVVLGIAWIAIEVGSGSSRADILGDAPYAILGILLIASGLGAYVMSLYRTAWNRRAAKWADQ